MKNRIYTSFEEFTKKGRSEFVNKHYTEGTTKVETLENPKDSIEKGGKVDHTEEIKADDLANPKNAK
jgi:hypothetical protein